MIESEYCLMRWMKKKLSYVASPSVHNVQFTLTWRQISVPGNLLTDIIIWEEGECYSLS